MGSGRSLSSCLALAAGLLLPWAIVPVMRFHGLPIYVTLRRATTAIRGPVPLALYALCLLSLVMALCLFLRRPAEVGRGVCLSAIGAAVAAISLAVVARVAGVGALEAPFRFVYEYLSAWRLAFSLAIPLLPIAPLLGLWLRTVAEQLGARLVLVRRSGRASRSMLVLVLLLSALLPVVPFLPTLNPSLRPVSVDIAFFYRMSMKEILSSPDPWRACFAALGGSRPLFFMLLYVIHRLGVNWMLFLDFLPCLLYPLFAWLVYLLVKELADEEAGFYAALLLVLFSIPPLLYGGFISNLLALPVVYAVVLFIVRGRREKWAHAVLFALGFVAYLVHPWTFLHLLAFVALFEVFKLGWRRVLADSRLWVCGAAIVAGDLFKRAVLAGARAYAPRITEDVARGMLKYLTNWGLWFRDLAFSSHIFLGGFAVSPATLAYLISLAVLFAVGERRELIIPLLVCTLPLNPYLFVRECLNVPWTLVIPLALRGRRLALRATVLLSAAYAVCYLVNLGHL